MFILVHTELTKPLIYMMLLSILIEIQNVNYTTLQLSWSIRVRVPKLKLVAGQLKISYQRPR
jgi:hypothetical protein